MVTSYQRSVAPSLTPTRTIPLFEMFVQLWGEILMDRSVLPDPVVGVAAEAVLEDHQGYLVVVGGALRLPFALGLAYPRRQVDAAATLICREKSQFF